jgi:alpha-beta hydrolase superfamily lysophospholipase
MKRAFERVEHFLFTQLAKRMFSGMRGQRQALPAGYQSITIESADGSSLEGALLPSSTGTRGVAVLCHPFSKYGFHYFIRHGLCDTLNELGLDTLLFNFKGVGNSSFEGPSFVDDVVGAVRCARELYPARPVYLFGASFGGYQALHALPLIEGSVVRGLFDSVPAEATLFFRSEVVSQVFERLNRSARAGSLGTLPIRDALLRVQRTELVLLHGSRDAYCTPEEMQRVCAGVPKLTLEVLPGASHLDATKGSATLYREFFERHLRQASAPPDSDRATAGSAAQSHSLGDMS